MQAITDRRHPPSPGQLAICLAVLLSSATGSAQQPQIPTLQVCNLTEVTGGAEVKLAARADATHAGVFRVAIERLTCAAGGYPGGSVSLKVDMTDSIVGVITATTVDQLTSTGKVTPTAYLSGRCKAERVRGCRYWLMLADNSGEGTKEGSPDVVGFLVLDGLGKRVAYGTGAVTTGGIAVKPTTN